MSNKLLDKQADIVYDDDVMTIDEALGDLSIQLEVKRRLRADHQADALKLGIEALKRIKLLRDSMGYPLDKLLYGETED